MARLLVTDGEGERGTPFLRGILTHSLKEAGLSFEEAFELASDVRRNLLSKERKGSDEEAMMVTSRDLRAQVLRQLRRSGQEPVLRRYLANRESAPAPLTVRSRNGHLAAFSRGRHLRTLEACGLTSEEANNLTAGLYADLLEEGEPVVSSERIDKLSYERLHSSLGKAVAKRFLIWRDFILSGRPLILLVGGTSGSGKSTTATAVANRLDIVRTQSTDMLREVMRMMVPQRLLPVLHQSSFDAWRTLSQPDGSPSEQAVIDGYDAQTELVTLACEAVVQRATRERVSLILEGVHAGPALLNNLPPADDALVMPVMVAVLDREVLRRRIRGRGSEVTARRAKRYLEAFDSIWELQAHLLSEADRADIPIISNTDESRVFREIMLLIINRLADDFTGNVKSVFDSSRLPLRIGPDHLS